MAIWFGYNKQNHSINEYKWYDETAGYISRVPQKCFFMDLCPSVGTTRL